MRECERWVATVLCGMFSCQLGSIYTPEVLWRGLPLSPFALRATTTSKDE